MEAGEEREESLEAEKAEEEEVEIDLSEMNEEEGFKVHHLTKFPSSSAIQIPICAELNVLWSLSTAFCAKKKPPKNTSKMLYWKYAC